MKSGVKPSMELTLASIPQAILLEPDSSPDLGSDQAYDTYPVRFPDVLIALQSTEELIHIADAMRAERGYAPLLPMEGWTDEDLDPEGWYNFYAGLNGYTPTKVDTCITFVLANSHSPDNEDIDYIPISEDVQRAIWRALDIQLTVKYGKGCQAFLDEAREEMMKDV